MIKLDASAPTQLLQTHPIQSSVNTDSQVKSPFTVNEMETLKMPVHSLVKKY